jgi:hypothetical protein
MSGFPGLSNTKEEIDAMEVLEGSHTDPLVSASGVELTIATALSVSKPGPFLD